MVELGEVIKSLENRITFTEDKIDQLNSEIKVLTSRQNNSMKIADDMWRIACRANQRLSRATHGQEGVLIDVEDSPNQDQV